MTNGALSYLATPYTRYPAGIDAAFREAARVAGKLLAAGVNVYSPIAHSHPLAIYGGLDPLDYSFWLPANETMIRLCDQLIVVHMDGWDKSIGVRVEVEAFEKAGKPIWDCDPETLQLTKRQAAA